MVISSKFGEVPCLTLAEYEAQLKSSLFASPGNEIWCYRQEGQDFPCLSILVKDTKAVVNYFSEDNGQMFASLGDLSQEGLACFENGKYEVAAYQVIQPQSALECALHFFRSPEKPSCIQWEEL
ncbi:hypothetical protein [Gorillibacterium sp. CAU 1737]|uniref:hypothetical protein n=1 Tax=Gorillibacterium sp. CAU 1737 TaxID=3140362 RepID=UPI003260CA5B